VLAAPATVSGPRLQRASLALALGLGLLVTALGTHAGACAWSDALGTRVARALSDTLQWVAPKAPDAELFEPLPVEVAAIAEETPQRASHAKKNGRHPSNPNARAVRISAAQVLALASRRAIPQAVPVPATATHPAGLLLRGVSGLGIGMRDGDVLTEAAGLKASSVGAVIGAVVAARARQSREISGRFFRGGESYQLVVEQPYPESRAPEADSNAVPG